MNLARRPSPAACSARPARRFAARKLAVSLAAAVPCASAFAEGPEFKFSGFGTLSEVHSNDKNGDFVSTRSQTSGAGHKSAWSFEPDTKLGGQVNAVFNDQFSAVLQVVSQHQYDNSFTPHVEWANVKYQVTSELAVRLGRIAAPSYLLSESRFVGYSNPWARPPTEVYSVLPVTSNDGVDAVYRNQIGGVNNTLQAYFGSSTFRISETASLRAKTAWGLNDAVEFGSFTLRAGYSAFDINLRISNLDSLYAGLAKFAAGAAAVPVPSFQTASAQAQSLIQAYDLQNVKVSALALGAIYDPGKWFAMAEAVAFKGNSLLADSFSWYASGGYRFGKFTPYATLASTRAFIKDEPGITNPPPPLAAGAAGLNAGINAPLHSINALQETASIGLRWDVLDNIALKLQYDRIHLINGSNGRFIVYPGFTPKRNVDLATVALDFVF